MKNTLKFCECKFSKFQKTKLLNSRDLLVSQVWQNWGICTSGKLCLYFGKVHTVDVITVNVIIQIMLSD